MGRRQMWTSAGYKMKMAGSKTDPPYILPFDSAQGEVVIKPCPQ